MNLRRLLLTTDFSDCSRRAYRPTADLARGQGAHVDLVHVVEYPIAYDPTVYQKGEQAFETYRSMLVEKLAADARGEVFQEIETEPHLLEGYGPDEIRKFAEEKSTDLLIQSSRGYTGLKRFFLGSFAERTLRLSHVPTLTIKSGDCKDGDGAPIRPQRILFPCDLSPSSAGAVPALRLFAETFDASVLVLHVWQDLSRVAGMYGISGEMLPVDMLSASEDISGKLRQDLDAFARRELDGLKHEEELVAGNAAASILERAESWGADMICMATHGWTGLKHVFLGSVAEKVARGAHCATLTVRPPPGSLRE